MSPIEWHGRRERDTGPTRRALLVPALDPDQEKRSADAVTGRRHEPIELVLGRLPARLAVSGPRAHIPPDRRSVVEFAARR